jgi:hypothetical protein
VFVDGLITAVEDMVDGNVFIPVGTPAPFMKCSLGQQPFVVPLAYGDAQGPRDIVNDGPSFGVSLQAIFRCRVDHFAEGHEQIAASNASGCLVNPAGLWLRTGQYWLKLSNGRLQTDLPATPWLSNGWVGIFLPGKAEPVFNIGPGIQGQ